MQIVQRVSSASMTERIKVARYPVKSTTNPCPSPQHTNHDLPAGERFGRVAIFLHSTVAAAMLCNVALALSVDVLPDEAFRKGPD
ncbi:hypothetical protein [Burkholderia sp. A9]|uniref:hypothetical protein n=1 Tax=Burkholderia sp. A9 TaxID=1365108 RepID=UPI001379294F|nr:hypothetical protein [Burkholderia sp. A9]